MRILRRGQAQTLEPTGASLLAATSRRLHVDVLAVRRVDQEGGIHGTPVSTGFSETTHDRVLKCRHVRLPWRRL